MELVVAVPSPSAELLALVAVCSEGSVAAPVSEDDADAASALAVSALAVLGTGALRAAAA
jgi:hypothetical protein